MQVFTILGIAIFILFILIGISFLINAIWGDGDYFIGLISILILLSVLIAIFIVEPQKFGYEKITVSENSVVKE